MFNEFDYLEKSTVFSKKDLKIMLIFRYEVQYHHVLSNIIP